MNEEQRIGRVSALLDELVERERAVAAAQAASLHTLAALHREFLAMPSGVAFRPSDQLSHRSMRLEIAAALRVGERMVESRLELADRLTHDLPVTFIALQEGRITDRHARVLAQELVALDPAVRAELEARLLPVAERTNPARLTTLARTAVDRVDPARLGDRHVEAMQDRGVWVTGDRDGMATLHLHTDAVQIDAIHTRLTTAATDAVFADDTEDRSAGQVRADLAATVLLGSDLLRTGAGPITPTVTLTVPVLSLLGQDDDPAVLQGRTPIDIATAARLVGNATSFARILTDPITDASIAFDPQKYRITGAHRDFIGHRWAVCGMVGCGMPATRCDIDHLHGWADHGRSTHVNLWPLCRGHHTLKTSEGWTPAVTPDGVTWTSPFGRTYPVRHVSGLGPPIRPAPGTGADRQTRPSGRTPLPVDEYGDTPDPIPPNLDPAEQAAADERGYADWLASRPH